MHTLARIGTNRREKQMWFHLLQLWTLIAFHLHSPLSPFLSHTQTHSNFISEYLAVCVCVLISFTLSNYQINKHILSARSFASVHSVVHLALKLEILLFQCFKMTFAAQSNGGAGEKSQACHKFNKISNEKCYFKKLEWAMRFTYSVRRDRDRDKSNGKSGRAVV